MPRPALAKQPVAPNLDKVLVIGTDGTRWDLLRDAMRDGRAPNLARLARQGFARPSKLDYGPNVLTLSEVGWSSIASGVWPDKHGVDGRKFNMDPKQATKNGYLDFLTRVQRGEPRLDTYLASRLGEHRPAAERRPDLRPDRRALRDQRRRRRRSSSGTPATSR